MRMPEIAREMTSLWISEVPSKMVEIISGLAGTSSQMGECVH
jgi:hypothetical protein